MDVVDAERVEQHRDDLGGHPFGILFRERCPALHLDVPGLPPARVKNRALGKRRVDEQHHHPGADILEPGSQEAADEIGRRVVSRRRPHVWPATEAGELDHELVEATVEGGRLRRPANGLEPVPEGIPVARVVEQEAIVELAQLTTRHGMDLRLVGEDRAHLGGVDTQHRIGEVGTAVHSRNHSRGKPYGCSVAYRVSETRPGSNSAPSPAQEDHSMRRLPVLAFTLFALLALSACASSTSGTAAPDSRQRGPGAATGGERAGGERPGRGGGGGCSTSSEAAAVTVQIANFAFDPPEVTAKVGETIGWTNGDSTAHTATTDDGGCDTGNIAQNATAGLVFDAAGTYAYHCKIHPNMTGTITITE